MRLFKFLLYGFGFLIGLSIAFCSNTNYDPFVFDEKYFVETQDGSFCAVVDVGKAKNDKIVLGKQLFKSNCMICHSKNMVDDMTGPALANVEKRWEGRKNLLYKWIRNSSEVIANGDPYAVEIYNKFNKSVMPAFKNLTDEEIEAMLEYIDYQSL